MKKTYLFLGLVALSALGASIGRADTGSKAEEKFTLIHVSDLATMIQQNTTKLAIYDANNDKTRKESGVIPGAVLLKNYKAYNVKMLPKEKDTKLVFYCANTQCMASHAAAEKAVKAGYSDVNVMADGIQGWVKAGQKVEHSLN